MSRLFVEDNGYTLFSCYVTAEEVEKILEAIKNRTLNVRIEHEILDISATNRTGFPQYKEKTLNFDLKRKEVK